MKGNSRREHFFDRLLRKWFGLILTGAVVIPLGYWGVFIGLIRGGATSGGTAKYEFTLRESIVVASVAWSPDGKYIADTAFYGNVIHLWDVKTRKIVAEAHRTVPLGSVGELSWSPDGRFLPVCDYRGQIRIYASPELVEVHSIEPVVKGSCDRTAFSSDGALFTGLGITGQSLVTYSTKDWQLIKSYDLDSGWFRGRALRSLAYIPGTHTLAVGGGEFEHRGDSNAFNGFVWMFEPEDEIPNRAISVYQYEPDLGLPGEVKALAMSPDKETFATGTSTGSGFSETVIIRAGVRILSLQDGRIIGRSLDGVKGGGPGGLQYSADGRYLITGNEGARGNLVKIIDTKTLKVIDSVRAGGSIFDLTTNPRTSEFAVAAANSIVVWKLPKGP